HGGCAADRFPGRRRGVSRRIALARDLRGASTPIDELDVPEPALVERQERGKLPAPAGVYPVFERGGADDVACAVDAACADRHGRDVPRFGLSAAREHLGDREPRLDDGAVAAEDLARVRARGDGHRAGRQDEHRNDRSHNADLLVRQVPIPPDGRVLDTSRRARLFRDRDGRRSEATGERDMLVTFKTKAYANITMFGDVAVKLLRMMGHSGTVPSAILADDVPAALERLKAAIAEEKKS